MQQFGLQVRYMADDEFSLRVRMIGALALVPPNNVIDSFDNLAQDIRNDYGQDMDDILDYFEDNYVATDTGLMLSFPEKTMLSKDGIAVFKLMLLFSHPSFWKFIDILKQEEGIARAAVLQN